MASRAKARLDLGGALVAGGTSTALTVTTNQSLSSSHIANGLRLCVRTASAATGAATIAVDGLTAVDIKKNDGTAIASGEWASGGILDLVYSSTASAFIATNIGSVATRAGLGLATSDSPEFAGINIGAASDTTITRASAGLIAVEGVTIEPGSGRCSFYAHKNGTNQTISSTAETTVSFGTEAFDTGSKFASNTWTPVSGTVLVSAHVTVSTGTVASGSVVTVRIKKNAAVIALSSFTVDTIGWGETGSVSAVSQANGSDTFTVTVESSDSSYIIDGTVGSTAFSGTMV